MPSAGRLQLDWRVAPSAQAFLNAISPCTDIAAPTSRSLDYSELKGMRREQQEQRLLQLAQAGQKIAAIKIARELYGYDLTQGRAFVEDLVGKRE
jgi:ribosomal protein L7/L12